MKFVVDASALLAVFLGEADQPHFESRLMAGAEIFISPVNLWEVHTTIRGRQGEAGTQRVIAAIDGMGISVEPITLTHTQIAIQTRAQYGGRPARLNLGDCFAYALAKSKNLPLLYKGGDFSHTDIQAA